MPEELQTDFQKIGQLADIANKEFSRFAARLRRMGHDKPGKQVAAMDISGLDVTTQRLFHNWRKAEADLERECSDPAQGSLPLTPNNTDAPDDEEDESNATMVDLLRDGLDRLLGDTPRHAVTEERFEELRALTVNEEKIPIKATLVDLNEQQHVVVGVIAPGHGMRGLVMLNRVVPKEEWHADTYNAFREDGARHAQPGVIIAGPRNKKYVTTGDGAAVLIGDPLGDSMTSDVGGVQEGIVTGIEGESTDAPGLEAVSS